MAKELQPDYPTPYGAKSTQEIKATIDKIYAFLEKTTPAGLINSKTKAIVVVHYAGIACNMDEVMQLASRYNLLVI